MSDRVPRYQWYIGGPKHGERITQTARGNRHVTLPHKGSVVVYHEEPFTIFNQTMRVWVADSLNNSGDHVKVRTLTQDIIARLTVRPT